MDGLIEKYVSSVWVSRRVDRIKKKKKLIFLLSSPARASQTMPPGVCNDIACPAVLRRRRRGDTMRNARRSFHLSLSLSHSLLDTQITYGLGRIITKQNVFVCPATTTSSDTQSPQSSNYLQAPACHVRNFTIYFFLFPSTFSNAKQQWRTDGEGFRGSNPLLPP